METFLIFAAATTKRYHIIHQNRLKIMLGIEEGPIVITGKDADILYEEYKSVFGEPVFVNSEKQG